MSSHNGRSQQHIKQVRKHCVSRDLALILCISRFFLSSLSLFSFFLYFPFILLSLFFSLSMLFSLSLAEIVKKIPRMHKPKGYWKERENRRTFFIKLAEALRFDPMQANNWTHVIPSQVIAKVSKLCILPSEPNCVNITTKILGRQRHTCTVSIQQQGSPSSPPSPQQHVHPLRGNNHKCVFSNRMILCKFAYKRP